MKKEPAWWAEARRMYRTPYWAENCRRIAKKLGKHHTSVLYAVNLEYRRDKIRQSRKDRSSRSEDDRKLDSLARKVRKEERVK